MDRLQALQDWAARQLGVDALDIAPASADASFRRYFRVTAKGRDYIVMDAPPAHEDCRPFIAVARLFADAGVHVPQVLAHDLEQGFLLLTDLGDTTYLAALNQAALNPLESQSDSPYPVAPNLAVARELYLASNDALIRIQQASRPGVLPEYDRALLTRELMLFPEWYVSKHLGVSLNDEQTATLNTVFEQILAQQPRPAAGVCASRLAFTQPDGVRPQPRHSRFPGRRLRPHHLRPRLDLSRCVYPVGRGASARLGDPLLGKGARRRAAGGEDFGDFWRDFEWMGAQRHIKVLGIFARLYHRDGKDGYLKDMPVVMGYLRKVCERYIELKPLFYLLEELADVGG